MHVLSDSQKQSPEKATVDSSLNKKLSQVIFKATRQRATIISENGDGTVALKFHTPGVAPKWKVRPDEYEAVVEQPRAAYQNSFWQGKFT